MGTGRWLHDQGPPYISPDHLKAEDVSSLLMAPAAPLSLQMLLVCIVPSHRLLLLLLLGLIDQVKHCIQMFSIECFSFHFIAFHFIWLSFQLIVAELFKVFRLLIGTRKGFVVYYAIPNYLNLN